MEVEGVKVPTLPLMAAPTVGECRFPVDVVYTWVDGSDPAWNAAREQRLAGVTGTAQTRESSGQARFIAHDELRYSLRSLHLFAPWVRRIHLVTAGQVPDWLDADHPMVNVVDHSQILPADGLPTFNSHAIETSLHRIEGLTEHFVYFNDDFLLGRPVRPETFFTAAGLCATYFSPMTIGLTDARTRLRSSRPRGTTGAAAGRVRRGDHPQPGACAVRPPGLGARGADRALRRAARRDRAVAVPVRHRRLDAELAGPALRAAHRRAHVVEPSLAFVNLSNADVDRQLSGVGRDQDFICLADHHDHALSIDQLDALLDDFYRDYFPVAAPWEKP